MRAHERTLLALSVQVSFELAESAAKVSRAVLARTRAEDEAAASRRVTEWAAQELRNAMGRPRINPTQLMATRLLYRSEQTELLRCEQSLADAQQHEQGARDALAGLRNRERSLERAIEVERTKQRTREQMREAAIVDDLWLQREWSERR